MSLDLLYDKSRKESQLKKEYYCVQEMRVLTLLPTDSAPGERQAGSGTSLVSTYLSPPCLENKLLARCSSLLSTSASSSFSCPSLHATSLSSNVTSTLLSISPSCITSPLLDTENRLLRRDLVPLHPSSSASTAQMLVSSLDTSSGALLRRFSPLSASSLRYPDLGSGGKEVPVGDEGDVVDGDGGEELSEEMRSSCKEKSMHSEGEEDDEAVAEIPVLKIELANQKHEATAAINLEEFPQIEREKDDAEEDLNDKKYLLLNAVCSSLVNAYTAPGQKDWDEDGSVWTHIKTLAKEISDSDPQFLLKVAVYTRQELNIRITANFLLALAAHQSSTKPHVRRYYCAAVQLPSDWLEVARIYSTCFTRCLPTCLKKAMVDKFKQFNEYQLAKYNTRKHRGKHNRKVPKAKTPSRGQIERWATLVRSDEKTLRNYMKVDTPSKVVDKKQKEFSLKKLIRRLHIKEPAQHVMALLGRKYPADAKAFIHSGLSGEWDRERAGQRMKLKQPETWERMLSQHGNKAATWEKLIDNQALPFMAMLRNLRNMITQGISETHHQRILSRLTNKRAVIQSRQLPLRFLAAYKVIMELKGLALAAQNALPQSMKILKGILLKIPKSKRFRSFDWETAQRKRLRVALGVPFVYSMYKKKKAVLQKANQRLYSIDLLDRYCKGLESAVQTSCRYNIPPLPGRTAILVCTNPGCDNPKGKYDFCIPPEPEQEGEKDEDMIEDEDEENGEEKKDETNKPTPTIQEVAVLLSLMIRSSAEDPMLCLYYWKQFTEVKLKSDVLLDNVRSVMRQIKEQDYYSLEQVLSDLFSKKNKWDNIIVVAHDGMDPALEWSINKYKSDVNDKALLVTVFLGASHPELSTNRNSVELNGFSEHILRFVAERGSSRLMDHVEHMDKLHKIPPPEGGKDPQTTTTVVPIPASPILRWRGVRVFISSTFRDMHAERDILVRSVFPELRRRAAPHCLYLQEVELRWGVTEEESGRAVELCLSEVCRSQMMVVILGERYGLVPPRPTLPDLPQYSWLTSAPAQLSITELEIRQFQALYPDSTHQRMFCYFRDPTLTESIPVAWRSHFAPESKQAQSKMDDLKTRILASGAKVTENYLCEWEGVVGGNPYLKGLEEFGKAVLEDLWTAVLKQYVGEGDEARAASDISEQYVHQGALQRQFYGRAKLLAGAVEKVRAIQAKGGVLLVDGAHGEGKTVFMAALANALRSNDNSKPACDVISYSTGASQSARCVENLLRCLVQWLRARKNNEEESPLPTSYKDLMTEFHDDMKKVQLLALLVDGVDLVQDSWGQLNSDWMPHQVPKGVCLVVSVTSGSALFQALSKKKGTILFPLGQLSMPDRREIVENGLDVFGKKLSDSAFNNQLQMLMMKKGAVTPLYLHLACEDLRNFATFDKMNESLQGLPQSLGQLVTHSLDRLCSQYKVVVGLRQALGALTVSCTGLRESDLYAILNTLIDLTSKGEAVTLVEVLHQARKPRGRVPMATFTHLVRSLQSLIGPTHCHGTDRLLAVTNPDVRRAFEEFFLPAEVDRVRAHLLLAAHLWAIADRQGTDTFLHCEGHPIMHLPSHLMKSDQWDALASLLSSYYFLYANVRHRLLHPLLLTYSSYNEKNKSVVSGDGHGSNLEECCSFLRRHAALLTSWPTLFVQQALNEPSHTAPHSWARALMGKGGGRRVVQLLNSAGNIPGQNCDLLSTFSSEPTCVGMSPDAGMMVVGTAHGLLHLIHTQTGQEVKRLASSCDGVSSCLFLTEGVVATTSFDGKIEIWNIDSGCRNVCIEGHANVITGSDVKADGKYFATVSLDYQLKVWSASKGHLEKAITSSSPLNCVTFNPDGDLLAAGCWNGNVNLWSWRGTKAWTYLSGHQRSVRSLSFSPSSSTLCSGSLSGEVKVWSVASSTCVGSYQAHSGSTAALAFLNEGRMLLSAGSDHTLHLWSGGLGRSLAVFEEVTCAEESPQKKVKACISEPAALCVAVDRDCAAVGYHGNGLKLFSLESGERTWASEDLRVSMLCLLWLTTPADAKQAAAALLVSGGGDNRLRVWKRPGEKGNLVPVGGFGVQQGSILALAQNSSHLASASDDFTIALWSVEDLTLEPWVCPTVVSVLRGHSGGVTCLAFSPDGAELLSGGKDQALLVWDVSSSVLALSRSFLHAHRDWITDCAWTSHCVVSCSNDGRLHVWHMESGECIARISWKSPLSSVCIQGQYLVAGCGEGGLHVWKWRSEEEVMEVSHISAHHQRIHHCSILPNRDETKEDIPEEMVVVTASDDGSVQLWKPFQVEHFCTFQGHSGAIHGVVSKKGLTEFLTVSEDLSLRSWVWAKESPRAPSSVVTAVCYSQTDDLLLAAYESGLMEIWRHNTVVAHKQASSSPISAVCSMPDGQFAAACRKPAVHVWKLVWNPQRRDASLVKISTYKVKEPIIYLHYCTALIGASDQGKIHDVTTNEGSREIENWDSSVRILGTRPNDGKSMWWLGESDGCVSLGFLFSMGPQTAFCSSFSSDSLEPDLPEEQRSLITAATVDGELVVCGDVKGNLWFNLPPAVSSWTSRMPAHHDRISVLRLTRSEIISASYDRTVKLWDRDSKKQVGMFVCEGPVVVLEVNPHRPNELVCGDAVGKLYFLCLRQ